MTRDIFALMGALVVGTAAPLVASDRGFDIKDFSEVAVSGGVQVDIVAGSEFHVDVDVSRRSLARNLTIRKHGDMLVIERDRGWSLFMLGLTDRYSVTVTMPELAAVKASAGAEVEIRASYGDRLNVRSSSGAEIDLDEMNAQNLDLRASSGSRIEAAGRCAAITARASSGAQIDAKDLSCAEATVRASSGAEIDLFATQTAEGRASSGGDIDIHGPARLLDISESSGGDVSSKG